MDKFPLPLTDQELSSCKRVAFVGSLMIILALISLGAALGAWLT